MRRQHWILAIIMKTTKALRMQVPPLLLSGAATARHGATSEPTPDRLLIARMQTIRPVVMERAGPDRS